jgi:hypothetical protein
MSLLEDEIELLSIDIDSLDERIDYHLAAPYEGRLCDGLEWHQTLRRMLARRHNYRLEREELVRERDGWQ